MEILAGEESGLCFITAAWLIIIIVWMIRKSITMNRLDLNDSDFKDIFPEVDVWEDGLYVDVSRKDTMTLGFALVRDGVHSQFSLPSNHTCTHQAELEAIAVGRRMFPGVTIFSDHYDAAKLAGAVYIPREKNKLAHYAAKYQKNYRWVPNLDFNSLLRWWSSVDCEQ
jgi:hypothetical protein